MSLGNLLKMAQVLGSLLPTWETQMKLLALVWPSLDCYSHLGSKSVDTNLSLSLSLSNRKKFFSQILGSLLPFYLTLQILCSVLSKQTQNPIFLITIQIYFFRSYLLNYHTVVKRIWFKISALVPPNKSRIALNMICFLILKSFSTLPHQIHALKNSDDLTFTSKQLLLFGALPFAVCLFHCCYWQVPA